MKKNDIILEAKSLRKTYGQGGGTVYALRDVSMQVRRGELLVILGSSGSGKSTLLNIIGGMDLPTSGRVMCGRHNICQMSDRKRTVYRQKKIGFVFQSFNLLPRYSSLENVALPLIYAGVPKEARVEKARKALMSVGLEERMEHKPSELSGGQRQRVAVARALINNPSIILADEPTGNLDTKTSIEIMNLFEQIYNNGNTVIVVTHEEDIARYARRIIRLRDGKVESDLPNNEKE